MSEIGRDEIERLAAAQRALNARRQRWLMWADFFGPLPPPSRRLRLRWWINRQRARLAHWIAPWEDYD